MLNNFCLRLFLALTVLLLVTTITPLTIRSLNLSAWLWVVTAVAGTLHLGSSIFKWKPAATAAAFILLAVGFSFLKTIFVWGGDWKTQDILYQHRHSPSRTIEFQMQNPGPGSYNRRTVEKRQLLPGLDWLREIGSEKIDTTEWKRVDIEVNEIGIKFA